MKPRALVLCGDLWHPAKTARSGLTVFHDYDFEFLETIAVGSARSLDDFSLVILAKANMVSAEHPEPWLTKDSQTVFVDYVRGGGGLLAIHAGTSRYDKLPLMNRLIGGAFTRHPEPCAVMVKPRKNHPFTDDIGSFSVHDEHYFVETNPDAEIFLESHSPHGAQPAGWTRTEGRGRVCALTPGHELEVWQHPFFQKLLSNALRWTTKMN